MQGTGRKMATWVVDTTADLHKSLIVGADILISNTPVWVKSQVDMMLKQC